MGDLYVYNELCINKTYANTTEDKTKRNTDNRKNLYKTVWKQIEQHTI